MEASYIEIDIVALLSSARHTPFITYLMRNDGRGDTGLRIV